MMKLMKKKKGFTLVELMAVVAILAILAAVLVPTVNGYINRSKKTSIVIQARAAVNAIEAYNVSTTGTGINTADADKTIASLIGVTANGSTDTTNQKPLFKDNDLLTVNDVNQILEATIIQVYKINENEGGNVVNTIKLKKATVNSKELDVFGGFNE